jgi:hypothetical protein
MADHQREPIRLTREELYEKVWQTPIVKLAETYGVSDVAIHKACERHCVPKPQRGYWAQVACGLEVERPPLPVVDAATKDVVIGKQQNAVREGSSTPKEIVAVPVPERLTTPHPLVERTLWWMERQQEKDFDYASERQADCLNIDVGKGSVRRGLRIWDALLKALEARGWSASIQGQRWQPKTVISKVGVKLFLRMRERSVSTPHVPSAAEKERMKRYPAFHDVPDKDWKLSGELFLAINDEYGAGMRRPRGDGAKGKLEDRVGDFISVIDEEYASEIVKEKERAEWHRKFQEEQRRREEVERRRKAEEKRIADLEGMAERWHKAERIRRFIACVEERASRQGPLDPQSELGQWIQWARQHAQQIDPMH